MVGDDHVDAYTRWPEAVRVMREVLPNVDARIASLEEYATAMPPLQHVVRGAIASGRYRPILRGVNSTRVWIKQENVACARLLLERCEPPDALTGGTAPEALRERRGPLVVVHKGPGERGGRLSALAAAGVRGDECAYAYAGRRVGRKAAVGARTAAVDGGRATGVVGVGLPLPAGLREARGARSL